MKKIMPFIVIALVIISNFLNPLMAHPGNTDSNGMHYCRTNCDDWGVPWNQMHGPHLTPNGKDMNECLRKGPMYC